MEIDKSQFFQVFYEETEEHLVEMEELLINLDIESPDQEDLNAIFRAVHSIKGGAGTFGFKDLTKVAHAFETVLDKVRKGEIPPTGDMIDLFLEGGDLLKTFVLGYREDSPADMSIADDVIRRLESLSEKVAEKDIGTLPEPSQEEGKEVVLSDKKEEAGEEQEEDEEDPGYGFFEEISLPEEGDNEAPVMTAQVDRNKKPEPLESSPTKPEKPTETGKISKPLKPVKAGKSHSENTSIRIDVEKVDQLFNQVGEIVITQAMLAQTASHLDPEIFERLEEGLAQLERNTRDLQESVMAIRMVPIRMVFNRFPRLVRDMKKNFNKDIELVLIGEETEIDKGFIEKLSDPLTHLLRNSFDHGIESSEARVAANKDPKGTIILSAAHQGGNVVIEVRDDGAGLNRERILAKAKEQGIPVPEGIPDSEIWKLIFAPGFWTAKKVSDISGRGVGMDVVKRNVQSMGGHIEIVSEEGKGSRFIIRLPLTLAIIEGMVIKVGKEVYIIPINSIVESIRPKPSEIKTILEKGELVNMRGEYIPIVRLYELFGVGSESTDPTKAVLSIIESEGGRVALMVDELLGQQQVVIKSMETNFRKVPGIAGGTILGDGNVAFIIDVRSIRSFLKQEECELVG